MAAPKKTAARAAARPRTTSRKAVDRRPAGPLVPLAVIASLALLAWVLYPALRLQYVTSRRVAGLEMQYDTLRKRNASLRAEVAQLKEPEGIEQAARQSLGLAKAGEHVYVVMPSVASTAQAEAGPSPKDERTAVQIVLDAVFGVEQPATVGSEP